MHRHQREWRKLSEEQRMAWSGFLRVHADVTSSLDSELQDRHRLSLSEYDVLVQLSLGTGSERRMWELADAVLLSRSGLTRLVERLERDGLATRRRAPDDARATIAAITDQGLQRLAEATPTHLDGVRRHFLEPLGEPRARSLAAAWRALVDRDPDHARRKAAG